MNLVVLACRNANNKVLDEMIHLKAFFVFYLMKLILKLIIRQRGSKTFIVFQFNLNWQQ